MIAGVNCSLLTSNIPTSDLPENSIRGKLTSDLRPSYSITKILPYKKSNENDFFSVR